MHNYGNGSLQNQFMKVKHNYPPYHQNVKPHRVVVLKPKKKNVKPGALAFFSGGSEGYGHIAIGDVSAGMV